MLPFGWGAQNLSFDLDFNSHMTEDETVKNWAIETSGSVRMPAARIVSSSEDPLPDEQMNCILVVPTTASQWENVGILNSTDLHHWIRSNRPETPNYAVCLLHSPISTRGVILKEVRKGILIKIGNYWQMESSKKQIGETRKVDWLIL
jgi:hypothetical protein